MRHARSCEILYNNTFTTLNVSDDSRKVEEAAFHFAHFAIRIFMTKKRNHIAPNGIGNWAVI